VAAAAGGVVVPPVPGLLPAGAAGAPQDAGAAAVAESMEAIRAQALQEAAQQQYLAAYTAQLQEAQDLHDKQQEAAQLALIMEAAEAQAEVARVSLEADCEEHHWHRRIGKNKICPHWQRGDCRRGSGCTFTHPEKERGTLAARNAAEVMRHNFKTSICKYFTQGNCPHNDRCFFAHGAHELRAPGMILTKDEEDLVQRVAEAKVAKATGQSKKDYETKEAKESMDEWATATAPLLALQAAAASGAGGADNAALQAIVLLLAQQHQKQQEELQRQQIEDKQKQDQQSQPEALSSKSLEQRLLSGLFAASPVAAANMTTAPVDASAAAFGAKLAAAAAAGAAAVPALPQTLPSIPGLGAPGAQPAGGLPPAALALLLGAQTAADCSNSAKRARHE